MEGRLTFLGTGTSMGVPTLGCGCTVCSSADPRDRRLRPSIMLQWHDDVRIRVVLIDTGPDFREQALRNKLTRVDAVFYTHGHADHILGLDDLRPVDGVFHVHQVYSAASPGFRLMLAALVGLAFSSLMFLGLFMLINRHGHGVDKAETRRRVGECCVMIWTPQRSAGLDAQPLRGGRHPGA